MLPAAQQQHSPPSRGASRGRRSKPAAQQPAALLQHAQPAGAEPEQSEQGEQQQQQQPAAHPQADAAAEPAQRPLGAHVADETEAALRTLILGAVKVQVLQAHACMQVKCVMVRCTRFCACDVQLHACWLLERTYKYKLKRLLSKSAPETSTLFGRAAMQNHSTGPHIGPLRTLQHIQELKAVTSSELCDYIQAAYADTVVMQAAVAADAADTGPRHAWNVVSKIQIQHMRCKHQRRLHKCQFKLCKYCVIAKRQCRPPY